MFCHDKPKKSATRQTAKKAGYREGRRQEEKRPERLHGLSAASLKCTVILWDGYKCKCGGRPPTAWSPVDCAHIHPLISLLWQKPKRLVRQTLQIGVCPHFVFRREGDRKTGNVVFSSLSSHRCQWKNFKQGMRILRVDLTDPIVSTLALLSLIHLALLVLPGFLSYL